MSPSERRRSKRKAELVERMLTHLLNHPGGDTSFRGLAAAAGVTRPTLVHYFGDHQGALVACLVRAGEQGRYWHDRITEKRDAAPEDALPELLGLLEVGWTQGVGRLHHLGIAHGLSDAELGRVYLEHIFDPSIDAFAELLGSWHEAGVARVPSPRLAAMSLVAPIILCLLRRHELDGDDEMSTQALVAHQVHTFLQMHPPA